jgi:hypothetical protein
MGTILRQSLLDSFFMVQSPFLILQITGQIYFSINNVFLCFKISDQIYDLSKWNKKLMNKC